MLRGHFWCLSQKRLNFQRGPGSRGRDFSLSASPLSFLLAKLIKPVSERICSPVGQSGCILYQWVILAVREMGVYSVSRNLPGAPLSSHCLPEDAAWYGEKWHGDLVLTRICPPQALDIYHLGFDFFSSRIARLMSALQSYQD